MTKPTTRIPRRCEKKYPNVLKKVYKQSVAKQKERTDVQEAARKEEETFMRWQKVRTAESYEEYKLVKKTVKRVRVEAKGQVSYMQDYS